MYIGSEICKNTNKKTHSKYFASKQQKEYERNINFVSFLVNYKKTNIYSHGGLKVATFTGEF